MIEKHINTHAHCFNIDHVPENFFDELIGGKHFLRISKIKNSPVLRFFIKLGTSAFVRWIVGLFSYTLAQKLRRLHGLIKYSLEPSQEKLIDDLDKFYPNGFKYVLLTMDMEHMEAGAPENDFISQVEELKNIKSAAIYKDKILPFVFVDPRRKTAFDIMKKHLSDQEAPFQGIKLYPALGYYPFHKDLLNVYRYAIEQEIPLITHCIVGDVYYRGDYWINNPVHEISKQSTVPAKKYKDPAWFQYNFTHPLNWECLLNPEIASAYFGTKVNLSALKICLGHFGGEEEWGLYLKQEKNKAAKYKNLYAKNPLDISQPWLGEISERYNWLTIIKELIKKYPNVYADISFTLHDKDIFPILKEMLKDPQLREKILFGTDYYVVATVSDEAELIKTLYSELTHEEIQLIAYDNPKKFLSSKLQQV